MLLVLGGTSSSHAWVKRLHIVLICDATLQAGAFHLCQRHTQFARELAHGGRGVRQHSTHSRRGGCVHERWTSMLFVQIGAAEDAATAAACCAGGWVLLGLQASKKLPQQRLHLPESASKSPMLTLSPSLTLSSLTTPAADDGISIDALSDSTVIK
jgi:hypothetical protein